MDRHLTAVTAAALATAGLILSAAEPVPSLPTTPLPKDARPGATFGQMQRALDLKFEAWKPQVNEEKTRGPAALVYPKAAPAVVVVRTGLGHGTGFFIEPDGWLLTNHHVVENALLDPKTGAQTVMIHIGQLKDGFMTFVEEGIPALVYKTDEEKDLALVKLTRLPDGIKTLPVIPLAKDTTRPGSDCVAIGHPAAGALWTIRSGEVAGVGTWPADMIDVLMKRLMLTGQDRAEFGKSVASIPKRRVLISSCGINPGDSGGPLLNAQGELIAVTFGVPAARGAVALDKISYHIHLDEVRAFLADRPKVPPIHVPDPWPPGIIAAFRDLNGDGKTDTLMIGIDTSQPPTGYQFDLDQDSPPLALDVLFNPARRKAWDFELAVQSLPGENRAFYDTDNDGLVDLVFIDSNGDSFADLALRRGNAGWTVAEAKSQRLIDPALFKDEKLSKRMVEFLKRLRT